MCDGPEAKKEVEKAKTRAKKAVFKSEAPKEDAPKKAALKAKAPKSEVLEDVIFEKEARKEQVPKSETPNEEMPKKESPTPPQEDAGKALEASQKSCLLRVIKISLDRSDGASLGAKAHVKENSLLLERIDEGLVAVWNSTAADGARVETGDYVIQVNNVAGSGMQLLKEIQQSE